MMCAEREREKEKKTKLYLRQRITEERRDEQSLRRQQTSKQTENEIKQEHTWR